MANTFELGSAEAGQRLSRFLERRLGLPRALARKWLRTGQVRVNGKRSGPDRVLQSGDILRLPPWCEGGAALEPCFLEPGALGPEVRILFQDDEILVLDKPRGLPVHGGTRHGDSLAGRIRAACEAASGLGMSRPGGSAGAEPPVRAKGGFYVPAPAHRLDLCASGLLVCGKTHAVQTGLHALFREGSSGLGREYLCWARGDATDVLAGETLCADWLAAEPDAAQNRSGEAQRMAVLTENSPGAREARAFYQCLEARVHEKYGTLSLIRARLLTGRKHQIRIQLASRGLPLLGDWRYGGSRLASIMLHASGLTLPAPQAASGPECSAGARPRALAFDSPPPWTGFFSLGGRHV